MYKAEWMWIKVNRLYFVFVYTFENAMYFMLNA